MNRTRRLIQILLAAAAVVTILLVVRSLRSRGPETMPADFSADGLGMEQAIFDGDNRRIIELKSSRSRKGEKDRIYMEDLDARVLSKGRMSEDIHVTGEEGYVENNYHNFLVRKNAAITSKSFTLKAKRFFLKDRALLRSQDTVTFNLRNLEGTAAKGLTYYLKQNLIKLFGVRGVHRRRGGEYHFQADILWFMEDEHKLILEKNAGIQGPDSQLKGNWISITFDSENKVVRETKSQGNVHLHTEQSQDPPRMRNIRCGILTGLHDENGDIHNLKLVHNVMVNLRRGERRSRIRSEILDVYFLPGGEKLDRIDVPSGGEVLNTGGSQFTALADRMHFTFKDGELATWNGEGNGSLRSRDFSCRSDRIDYNAPKGMILLKGKECRVINGRNVFIAPNFSIHTEKKWLRGEGNVRTTFHPKRPQPPFTAQPFFIRSQEVLLLDQKGTVRFTGSVQLLQDAAGLSAKSLTLNPDKHLQANKMVRLTFKSQDDEIEVWGDKLVFDPEKGNLTILDKGGIQSGETRLDADGLIISFSKDDHLKNISAEGSIRFHKDDISGESDKVFWDFAGRNMRFQGNASLSKKQGGKAEGEILEMDLESNHVRVRSQRQRRTSTLLDEAG